jgi:hypothetical protein
MIKMHVLDLKILDSIPLIFLKELNTNIFKFKGLSFFE